MESLLICATIIFDLFFISSAPMGGKVIDAFDSLLQKWELKVAVHCDGCARKVKKVLQRIDGRWTAPGFLMDFQFSYYARPVFSSRITGFRYLDARTSKFLD